MKKLFLGFLIITNLYVKAEDLKTEKLENICNRLYEPIKNENKPKIAIMDFAYTDQRKSEGSQIVRERITTILAGKKNLSLIERGMLKKVLEELKLQELGITDVQQASKIGNILGADYLILGTLNDVEKNKTEINARIVEVKTSKIISASSGIIEKTWKDINIPSSGNDYSGSSLIQIAILLDTSNSMDGLINQARSYIWKIVNKLSSAEKDNSAPVIEVALYEYGNNGLPKEKGYIRQVSNFTTDLDRIAKELFALKTNGGDEYCGWVIKDALENLNWSKKDDVYKAIFIAGNESFTQGPVNFEEQAILAKNKGIFINTIFCGNRQQGIAYQWKKAADITEGDYSNIDQDIEPVIVSAPQDDEITKLTAKLNETYIPYGDYGKVKFKEKQEMDTMTLSVGKGIALERATYQAKAPSAIKSMSEWDLISAIETGKIKISEIKKEDLPQDLQNMSQKELEKYIDQKIQERKEIREKISKLTEEREKFLKEKEKTKPVETLDKAILNSIKKQAEKKGYKFKD